VRHFTDLIRRLDETNKTGEKVAAVADYLGMAPPGDAAWAVFFLRGERPKRLVGAGRLRAWAQEASGLDDWMFAECYESVGDLAETCALLVGDGDGSDRSLAYWVEERLLPMGGLDDEAQRAAMLRAWSELDELQRFAWNKWITGGMRLGVSKRLVVRAIEKASGIEAAILEHRLMGRWKPSGAAYEALISEVEGGELTSRPYPFLLAHPLPDGADELGERSDWQVEWKWDGIRAQVIRRAGETFLWTRGEELVTDRYPEIRAAALALRDGTALDGELLAWRDGAPLPFSRLQRRIGRKKLSGKILREIPVRFLAYDLLESGGEDLRSKPLSRRRGELEDLIRGEGDETLGLSSVVDASSWDELAELHAGARELGVEGFMLKRLDAPYSVGRPRGVWWKWKVEPMTVDAVLLYAQRGHGRRSSFYTDYTFAVWEGEKLVPFAKAYSGLSNEEIRRVDRFVRQNTLERFGPVRSVKPELGFEIAFEAIELSSRHKSGIAVRFPRIARWREEMTAADADRLESVRQLLGESQP